MNLTLVLTHDCNLRCTYCYAGRKFARAMPWDVARRGIDIALADGAPWTDLGFFGGEPLLALPLMKQALAYARSEAAPRRLTIRPQVTTNATLLTDETVRYLRSEGFHVGLSLDGVREAHEATRPSRGGRSSFDAALAGLDRALAAGLRAEVILVSDPANVRWLAESVAFVADRGARRIVVSPNFHAGRAHGPQPGGSSRSAGNPQRGVSGWDDAARAEFERQARLVAEDYAGRHRRGDPVWVNFIDGKIITRLKNGYAPGDRCGFGVREISVAPSGNIYPCERLVGDDTDAAVRMGNVFDGVDLGKQARYRRVAGARDPECEGCALRPRCANWCGCTNYSLTGAIDRTGDVVCWHEKTVIPIADRTAATLFREARPAFLKRHYGVDVDAPPIAPAGPGGAPSSGADVPPASSVPGARRAPVARVDVEVTPCR